MDSTIFDADFFTKLNTLKMCLNMPLSQGMNGLRKSSAKGTSVEFSDFREYMLGDDIRRIDWNAYGRTDKLYIKQFMEEKEGRFHIFVDTSGSMNFGAHPKSRMALQMAGAFAYVVLHNLDRVYVNEMKENALQQGKGVTGMAAFSRVLQNLNGIHFEGGTSLNRSILSRPLAAGGCSIILSDFLDSRGVEEAVKYLAYKKQHIVMIQILAAEEKQIDYEGTVNIVDMETEERVKITMSGSTVAQYRQQLEFLQDSLQRKMRRYGGHFLQIQSDDSLINAMLYGFQGLVARR